MEDAYFVGDHDDYDDDNDDDNDDQLNNDKSLTKSPSKYPNTPLVPISPPDTLDAPKQPILKSYDPRKFGNDIRDFNADWYNDHPWLEYSVEAKTASCYACKTYNGKNFTFSNWKKPERLSV